MAAAVSTTGPVQKQRRLAVYGPLDDDALVLRQMTATEQLGRLFEYRLEVYSEDYQLDFDALLGENMTVRMDLLTGGETRYFNGFVSDCWQGASTNRTATYQITLRPWLWFLTRTADCRIFQEKTAPDIIKEVFRDSGFSDFEESLSGDYRQREYCVQYRETDFNFVSRLMEEEGIYYYFKHQNGKHMLVLSDSYSAHDPFPGYEEIPYYPPDMHNHRERDHIFDWSISKRVQPGRYALNDFDFKVPKKNLRSQLEIPRAHAQAQYEIYDYPGEYKQSADGDHYSRVRIEELQAQHETLEGQGNAAGLATGALFKLTDYPRADQNREYLVASAHYTLQSDEYESGPGALSESLYECRFSVIDAQQPYRPPRVTPKPVVQGPQTAIVTGPEGEEIWTDEHGRVKCQFHWDRYGSYDEQSSCWIRVSHPWAGKGWGSVSIPRIGQEVIVDFIEGDPDQPIVTGRVYNGDQKPPYGLPDGKVISGIMSNSTKGGGGYNEFVMNDTKGDELIRTHAQYDMDTTVENDQRNTIKNDQTDKIMNNRSTTVESGNDTLTIAAGTRTVTVKGNSTHTVQAGERTVTVTGGNYNATSTDAAANITGKTSVSVTGESAGITVKGTGKDGVIVDGKGSVGVGLIGKPNIEAEASTMVKITAPDVQIGDNTILIKGSSITLDAGGGQIVLDGSGVTIIGAKITSQASGPNTIIGAVVNIN